MAVRWAPIGNYIAYDTYAGNQQYSEIYFLDIETGDKNLILSTIESFGTLSLETWAPDSESIIFITDGGPEYHAGVWAVDIRRKQEPIYLTDGHEIGISKAGRMAIQRKNFTDGVITIHVTDGNSGSEHLIYSKPGIGITELSWSPEGDYLVFDMHVREDKRGGNITILEIASGTDRLITSESNSFDPVWSPTRNIIAYIESIPTNASSLFTLHLTDPSGRCDRVIEGIRYAHSPSWSPDGNKIAYIERGSIYVVDLVEYFGEEFLSEEFPCNIVE